MFRARHLAAVAAALATIVGVAGSWSTPSPRVSRPPQISAELKSGRLGSAIAPFVGEALTATSGGWSNSPTQYVYQWQDCDAAGASCVDIAGATSTQPNPPGANGNYTIKVADVGHTIRVVVTASNSGGAGTKPSASTGVVTNATGTIVFDQGFESGPFTTPGTPGGLYQGVQAGNWSGQSAGAKHYFGDAYVDNGTSSPLTTNGSIFNLAGSGNVPPGDGQNSWRTVTPVAPTGQGYNLESTAANSPTDGNTVGDTKYYGLMFYLPPGGIINSSQPYGSIFYQIHWTNSDPPGVGMALHTTGGSDINGTGDSVVLAIESGACNPSSGTAGSPGCQYRSNAASASCPASDPNLGTIHCLPGTYVIPPGQLQYGTWEEVILGVDWESAATGSFHAYYKTKTESTWHTSGVLTNLPTVQWNLASGCCGAFNEHLDVYLGLESSPFQMSFDDQVIGTTLAVVENALPTVGAAPVAPANTALPVVSGTTQTGVRQTSTDGTWTGSPAPTFTYQWRRCDATGGACVSIAGATASAYTLVAADETHTLRLVVTGSNSAGSASATSLATAVVTAPSQGAGTGPSPAQCGAGGCTATGPLTGALPAGCVNYAPSGTSIATKCTYNGTGSNGANEYYFVQAPGNLNLHDLAHPVPIVFVANDGCTGNDTVGTPGLVCFTNSDGTHNSGVSAYGALAPGDHFMLVDLFTPNVGTGSTYGWPITFPGGQANAWDQGYEEAAAVANLSSFYSIDSRMVFFTGGSKGGDATIAAMCDPKVEPLLAGVGIGSAVLAASGTSPTNAPAGANGGSCPALVSSRAATLPAVPPGAHPLMVGDFFSAQETGLSCSPTMTGIDGQPPVATGVSGGYNCHDSDVTQTGGTNHLCVGGFCGGTGVYVYPHDQLATNIVNPLAGCSNTPIGGTQSAGTGGGVKFRVYGNCSTAVAGDEVIDFVKSTCHAYGCEGVFGIDVAAKLWNYWTTGT